MWSGWNYSSAALMEIFNENVVIVSNRRLIIMRISTTHKHTHTCRSLLTYTFNYYIRTVYTRCVCVTVFKMRPN